MFGNDDGDCSSKKCENEEILLFIDSKLLSCSQGVIMSAIATHQRCCCSLGRESSSQPQSWRLYRHRCSVKPYF